MLQQRLEIDFCLNIHVTLTSTDLRRRPEPVWTG